MKITGEMYNALQRGLFATLQAHNLHPFMVQTERHAWDLFHKAWHEKRIDGHAIYKIANDANIAAAMRKIFKR